MGRDCTCEAVSFGEDDVRDQARFEAGVLAVLAETLASGRRIDVVAQEWLRPLSWGQVDEYVYPDLIICVSDCLTLIRGFPIGLDDVQPMVERAAASWSGQQREGSLSKKGSMTRIQAALGNVGRALKAAMAPESRRPDAREP